VQRWSEECAGGLDGGGEEGRVEGVMPGVIVLAQGAVGRWCRRTHCPCRQPGFKLPSLSFPVAFLQRQAGAVGIDPARAQQVRVKAT